MQLLFLSSVYPHATAPVRGTFNRQLCRALTDCGHDVRVIAPRPWPETLRERMTAAQPDAIVRDDIPVYWPTFFYPPKVLRSTYGSWMWHSVKHSVLEAARTSRPDWIISYWAHPDGEAGRRAARACGAKSAVIIGGSDVLLLPRNPHRRRVIQRVLRQSDLVLTVSDGLRDAVLDLGGDPRRTRTVYQGVDTATFCHGEKGDRIAARQHIGLPSEAPVFVWVGRMVEVKRVDVLLDAFRIVRQTAPRAMLNLIGCGPLKASLQAKVQRSGLGDAVKFVGAVAQEQLANWYRAADATVLSSDSEGIPNVLRESLACGTPWVSTNVGSVAEFAVPGASLLVPRADADAMAEAMRQIVDPVFRAGAASVATRTWRDAACDLTRCLEEVDQRKSVAPTITSPQEAARS